MIQFWPVVDWNFEKKLKNCFIFSWGKQKNYQKFFLFFRKLTQISVISRVLELNYHKNSQRYIEFNFDPKNNYFRLKSENFIILGPKLEIWRFTQFDFSSSNPQKIIILEDIISFGEWEHIYCIQTFHFFIKKVSLSISH